MTRSNTLPRIRAKKALGQNFLKSHTAARLLVESAHVAPETTVVEVGPGKGAITKILLEEAGRVIAIEKDPDMHAILAETFTSEIAEGRLTLVLGDILAFNVADYGLADRGYTVVGSLPYYITGIFIRTFLTLEHQPAHISLIIQKEVAERIVVRDGKASMLSVSVAAYGTPKYIKTIKAREFSPAPKVDSAILAIEGVSRDFFEEITEDAFFTVVRAGFAQKRKKLVRNLTVLVPKEESIEALETLALSPNVRAEDLTIQQWGDLTGRLYPKKNMV